MLNNIMGSGMGNIFSSNNFAQQMGFNANMNNIFSQFGNMGNQPNGFFMNQNNIYNNYQNEGNNQNEDNIENNESEEEENEEELRRLYVELRNSVINELPRFKFNDYKRMNNGKEIHE